MATSKFIRILRGISGVVIPGANIWLVLQANSYPTGTLMLTESSSKSGYYYRDAVPDGEYKIYIDEAGGSTPSLYEEHVWHGEARITTISDHFDNADNYKLKPTGISEQTKTVVSVTDPIPDYIGQIGRTAGGVNYIAIALTGTMWEKVASSDGFLNPMTAIGDLMYANTAVTVGKKAIGSLGQVLTVIDDGGDLKPDWQLAAAGGSSFCYNAKTDFGAVGDGVTNDTTPIQAAFNASALNKKALYIPAGTYMVDPIYMRTNTLFFGAGMGITIIKLISGQSWGTAYDAVLTNENILPLDFGGSGDRDEHIYGFDITLDGNKAGQSGTNSEAECLSLYGAQDCYFDRIETINAYASGIDIDYCDRIGFGYVLVKDSRLSGIHFSVGSPQGVNEGNDNCWINTAIILNSGESALTDTYYGGGGTGIGDGKGYYNHFGYVYADTCSFATAFKGVTLGGISCKLDQLILSNVTGDGLEINSQSVNVASNYNTVGKATFLNISGTNWQIDGGTGYFWENDIYGGVVGGSLINLNSGLIESWDLNETSGVRQGLLEAVSLVDNNTVGYVSDGVEVNAAHFIGTNSEYLSAASSSLLNTFKAVSFWVRFDSIVGTGLENGMIGKDGAGSTEGDMYVEMNDGKILFNVQGSVPMAVTSVLIPTVSIWYHIICTYDGTNGHIYINGELDASGAGDVNMGSNTNAFTLGARNALGTYLNGDLDMVQIWSKHINIYEARLLYTLGLQ